MQKIISGNIFSRVRAALKNKKKNPDWARVDEPDSIAKGAEIAIYGLFISGFVVVITWQFMLGSPIQWIAYFLFNLNSVLPFNQLYAAFASAVIVLINLFVTVIFIMFAPANNDDIVEMLSDLDSSIQERIVELDNKVSERLDEIIRNA